MYSIITENFKQEIIESVLEDIRSNGTPYYIGIGKSEVWNLADSPDIAYSTVKEQMDLRRGLQGISLVNASSFVVTRHNWTSGTVYDQYDDTKQSRDYTQPYYVINANYNVYICLETGKDNSGTPVPSTVEPTVANNDPFKLSDGYVWKFLYTVSALEANFFMSRNYMPVKYQESVDSNSTGIELKQWEIQQTAKPRMITSFDIDSGGLGYSNPTLRVNSVSDPDNYFNFTLDSNGAITKIGFTFDSDTTSFISDLKGALIDVVDSTGIGAVIRPIFSTSSGIGSNAIKDLRSKSFMLNVKIADTIEDFITSQDFRQIAILRNVKDSSGGSLFTDTTGTTLYSMTLSSNPVAFTKDRIIVGSTSGAQAYIDNVVNSTIYYHQTDETGYIPFISGENVTEIGGTGAGVINTPLIAPEADPFTGDILYISNRTAVERVPNQTEDIKIVIDLDDCGFADSSM